MLRFLKTIIFLVCSMSVFILLWISKTTFWSEGTKQLHAIPARSIIAAVEPARPGLLSGITRRLWQTRVLSNQEHVTSARNIEEAVEEEKCPDVLSGMTRGHWQTRALSTQEQSEIDTYLRLERGAFRIPPTFERQDKKCGVLPYAGSPLYSHMWFKAICNPKGSTPCCRTDRCEAASVEDCRCPTCYDERQAIHAEYAKWVPDDRRCSVRQFSAGEACDALRGYTVEFVGDSFIRHMFAATVILLSGGGDHACLTDHIPYNIRTICKGMHQFTALQCREFLNETRNLCNGTVKMRYTQVFPASDFLKIPLILKKLRHPHSKSLLVMGLGIHDDFNFDIVNRGFLLPFLNLRQNMFALEDSENLADKGDGLFIDLGSVQTNFSSPGPKAPKLEYLIPRDQREQTGVMHRLIQQKLLKAEFFKYTPRLSIGPTSSKFYNKSEQFLRHSYIPKRPAPLVFQSSPKPGVVLKPSSPNVLWVGIHAPGLLKSPKFKRQTAAGVIDFNRKTEKVLKEWSAPYLDTFSFSNGTVSFDGCHYGWGVNMLKAQMLINYIKVDLGKGRKESDNAA